MLSGEKENSILHLNVESCVLCGGIHRGIFHNIMETPRKRIETTTIAVKHYAIIKPLISTQLIQVVHYQRYATILNRELTGS